MMNVARENLNRITTFLVCSVYSVMHKKLKCLLNIVQR